jgi:transcription elongation factor GreA
MPGRVTYLSREAYDELKAELEHLTGEGRRQSRERLRRAREDSDTLDKTEFEQAWKDQTRLEERIRELDDLLSNATIVQESDGRDFVAVGARVQVKSDDGEIESYTIVGTVEADARKGKISNESPIGRALMGKRVGQKVRVVAPAGSFGLEIVKIE